MLEIILGSQSARRREILSCFNVKFEQVSSGFDESSIPFDGNPYHYVDQLSKAKAHALFPHYSNHILLTADTIVYKDGKVYGKPESPEQAFSYLRELSGEWHSVLTGVTVRYKEQEYQGVEETRVRFNALTNQQIQDYLKAIPYEDKAGGYMIQRAGGLIVNRIDGCYYNVVGLPLNVVERLLKQVGFDLWQFLG